MVSAETLAGLLDGGDLLITFVGADAPSDLLARSIPPVVAVSVHTVQRGTFILRRAVILRRVGRP